MAIPPLLGGASSTLSVNKLSLVSDLNFSWCSLRPFLISGLISLFSYFLSLRGRGQPPPHWTSCQGVVETEKVPLSLLFLQAEHPQIPQPFLIKHVLLSPAPFLTLDMLQDLHTFLVVQGTKLDTEFEVQPGANIQVATWRPGLLSTSCRLNRGFLELLRHETT